MVGSLKTNLVSFKGLSCSKNLKTITADNCHSYISWMEFVFDVRDCTTLYCIILYIYKLYAAASSLATLTHPWWLSLCDTELVYQRLVLTCCHMWAERCILIVNATVGYIPLEMDWDWAGRDIKGEREGVE